MAYLTAAEARERRMALLSGVADAEIDRLVSEFEALAERFVRVPMVPRASVVRVAVPSPVVSLAVDGPVRSVTSVAVDGVAVSGTHKFSGSVVYPSVAVGPGWSRCRSRSVWMPRPRRCCTRAPSTSGVSWRRRGLARLGTCWLRASTAALRGIRPRTGLLVAPLGSWRLTGCWLGCVPGIGCRGWRDGGDDGVVVCRGAAGVAVAGPSVADWQRGCLHWLAGDLHRKPEMVFVDELSSTEDRPVMKSGRQVRDESFRLPLIVVITGRGDLDSTMCRTSAVVAAIQDVLADEPALSDLDGVLFGWVARKSMSCGQTPEGPIGTARVVVDVTARLN